MQSPRPKPLGSQDPTAMSTGLVYASVENVFSSSLLPSPSQDSQLSDHLRANLVPKDVTYIRSVDAAARLELARYNIDIRIIQAALDKAVSERDAFQLHADRCRSLLAPIRALPPEILLKIFALVAAEASHLDGDFASWSRITTREHTERLGRPDLLRLSSMCCLWRTLIMGTPSLWTTIQVNTAEWMMPSIARRLNTILPAALERSDSSPLHLKLRTTGQFYEWPVIDMLAQTSLRWQRLNCWITSNAHRYLGSVKGKLPQLETLEIHGDFLHELTIFEDAPRLAEVTLRRSGSVQPPPLPWHQLRTLSYEDGNATELRAFFSLLDRCTALRDISFLNLDVSNLASPSSLALPPAYSATVESLSIILRNTRNAFLSHNSVVLSEILGSFTLPCVKHVALHMNVFQTLRWTSALANHFAAFVAQSEAQITSLALHRIKITPHQLLECLALLSHLEVLHVDDLPDEDADMNSINAPVSPQSVSDFTVITDDVLRQLTWIEQSYPNASLYDTTSDAESDVGTPPRYLVPRLKILTSTSIFRFSSERMLAFVKSRGPFHAEHGGRGPFELHLCWDSQVTPLDPVDAELIVGLDALQRKGELWYSITATLPRNMTTWLYNSASEHV